MTSALWNSADKSANIALSGGSLVATSTSSAQGAVRADTSVSSGKHIFSVVIGAEPSGNFTSVGWANSSAVLSTALGADTNSVGIYLTTGNVVFNNLTIGVVFPTHNASVLQFALDLTNLKVWVQIDGGPWNNSVTADPASNVGGFSIAALAAGPYFPIFSSQASGQVATGVFGDVQPIYPIPSGFSTLNPAFQAYEATPKFLGYGAFSNYNNAAGAAKFLGYGLGSNFGTALGAASLKGYGLASNFYRAIGVAKLLGYAILMPPVPPPSTIQRTQGGIF